MRRDPFAAHFVFRRRHRRAVGTVATARGARACGLGARERRMRRGETLANRRFLQPRQGWALRVRAAMPGSDVVATVARRTAPAVDAAPASVVRQPDRRSASGVVRGRIPAASSDGSSRRRARLPKAFFCRRRRYVRRRLPRARPAFRTRSIANSVFQIDAKNHIKRSPLKLKWHLKCKCVDTAQHY